MYVWGLRIPNQKTTYYGGRDLGGFYYATRKTARTYFTRYDAVNSKNKLYKEFGARFTVVKIKVEGL